MADETMNEATAAPAEKPAKEPKAPKAPAAPRAKKAAADGAAAYGIYREALGGEDILGTMPGVRGTGPPAPGRVERGGRGRWRMSQPKGAFEEFIEETGIPTYTYGELVARVTEGMYQAYGKTTDFKNFRGDPMPSWDELPVPQREAWVAAAVYAVAELTGMA